MSKPRNLRIIALTLTLIAVATCTTRAIWAAGGDPMLKLVPADSLFSVRINNMEGTLSKLDAYLMGIMPVPVSPSMLAKMQLGAVLGDPALASLDMSGNIGLFGLNSGDSQEPGLLVAMLLPVAGFDDFVRKCPVCAEPDADGISTITSPNPKIGSLLATATPGDKFVLITKSTDKSDLATIQVAMNGTALAADLDVEESRKAATAGIWTYGNVERAVEIFGTTAFEELDNAMEEMEKAQRQVQTDPNCPQIAGLSTEMLETQQAMMKMYVTMLRDMAEQTRFMSITANISPDVLSFDFTLSATPDSELAGILTRDKPFDPDFKLAGYLDNSDAIQQVIRINKPMLAILNDAMFDMMGDSFSDALSEEEFDLWKKTASASTDAMGGEMAISFSYAKGMPPMRLTEIIVVDDPEAFAEMMTIGIENADKLYKAMGAPMSLELNRATDSHNGVSIDTMTITLDLPDDDPGTEMIKAMYGDIFEIKMATVDNLLLVTMGQEAQGDIVSLIDKVKAGPAGPGGDLKVAFETVTDAGNANAVASINVIRLASGLGDMLQGMPMIGQMVSAFLDKLNVPTQSCLAMSATIDHGKSNVELAIPKQHVMEIMAAVMQIQQQFMQEKMMKQMQQQQTTPSAEPGPEF